MYYIYAHLDPRKPGCYEYQTMSFEIGRRDLNTGPLLNKSSGGEKGIPYKWNRDRKEQWLEKTLPKLKGSHTISEKNQAKMQEGCKLFWNDPLRRQRHCEILSEQNPKYWRGKNLSDLHRTKLSAARKGQKQTLESIAKRRLALIGKPRPAKISISINQIEYPSIRKACVALGISHTLAKKMAGV